MIKIEESNDCTSYWRGQDVYDLTRSYKFVVRIFGIKIYEKSDGLTRGLTDPVQENNIGFKKK